MKSARDFARHEVAMVRAHRNAALHELPSKDYCGRIAGKVHANCTMVAAKVRVRRFKSSAVMREAAAIAGPSAPEQFS